MDNFTLISVGLNGTSYVSESSIEIVYGLDGRESTSTPESEIMSDDKELHFYLRVTCLIFLFIIFSVGTIGNIMVTLVIGCSRLEMEPTVNENNWLAPERKTTIERKSLFFLSNLSIKFTQFYFFFKCYFRDMRTSTNIFLVNLSIADLLVLLVCTPTALIEMIHHPDRWILGPWLCIYTISFLYSRVFTF